MARTFLNINYDRKAYNTIPYFIKEKTGIRIPDVITILDVFLYLFRKELLENKKIIIRNFGKLYLINYKRKGKIVFFKSYIKLKDIVNNISPNEFDVQRVSKGISIILKKTAKCFGIKYEEAKYIFNLFIYGIVKELLKFKVMKLRKFGIFEIYEMKFNKTNVCGIERDIERVNRVLFRGKPELLRVLNGQEDKLDVLKRSKRLLKLHNFIEK